MSAEDSGDATVGLSGAWDCWGAGEQGGRDVGDMGRSSSHVLGSSLDLSSVFSCCRAAFSTWSWQLTAWSLVFSSRTLCLSSRSCCNIFSISSVCAFFLSLAV